MVQGRVGQASVHLAFEPSSPAVIAASVGDSPFVSLDGITLTFDRYPKQLDL